MLVHSFQPKPLASWPPVPPMSLSQSVLEHRKRPLSCWNFWNWPTGRNGIPRSSPMAMRQLKMWSWWMKKTWRRLDLRVGRGFVWSLPKAFWLHLGLQSVTTPRKCQSKFQWFLRLCFRPEKCSENGCRHVAVSKCRECLAFLCLTHRQTIRKEEKSGDSTIVVEVPACSKCKEEYEKRNEDYGLAKCLCGFFVTLPIALILVLISLN